jgi:DNA ligase D
MCVPLFCKWSLVPRGTRYGPNVPSAHGTPVDFEVGSRLVRVSSPERIYFPEVGITKLEVVAYYVAVADGILKALDRRPTTLERWPQGVQPGIEVGSRSGGAAQAFFQKRAPQGMPEWVETARISFPSGRTADEICPTEAAVIAWAANLGTLTFHPWPVRQSDVDHPDELRIDLDPQPGTDFTDAVAAAHEVKSILDELGWVGFVKTSGGRGVHIYVRIRPDWDFTAVRHAAIALGRELERRMPGRVTTAWWKEERGERIFVDYNQNARDRTIASAYSIRPRAHAPVSTPVTWEELSAVHPNDFTVRTVPERFAKLGDLHAAIDDVAHDLTPLLEWYARDERDGVSDMPYPPDFPKMAGEPSRVQPSRAAARTKET